MESRYRVVLVFGSLVMLIALGIRHGLGLFLQPTSADLGWGREVFSIAPAPAFQAFAGRWQLGVERMIAISSSVMSAGMSAKSGVER